MSEDIEWAAIQWREGAMVPFMGWAIVGVEEDGRRFWKTTDPTPIGLHLPQEFSSASCAVRYIEKREIEKMLYRIKK